MRDKSCNLECLEMVRQKIEMYTTGWPVGCIIEPMQGPGGQIPAPVDFLVGLKEICKNSNILLIYDEAQTGFGRTGKMFASSWYEDTYGKDISPDIIFTHFRHDLHQDHQLISELTWNTFRDHFILEYEIPKYDGDFLTPNLFVELNKETCEKKINLIISCFNTQANKRWFDEETFWAILRLRGLESNSRTKYAEAFYSKKIRI